MRAARGLVAFVVGTAVVLAVAGCGGPTNNDDDTTTAPTSTPTGTQSSEPAGPQLVAGGTATENQEYFNYVNQEYWDSYSKGNGADIVTNLANHGFGKPDIEVTYDETAISIPADSIVVSVRIQGQCLIGQFGPSQYTGTLTAQLNTGKCLIGKTRPVDW